jgi:chromosome segregation ATPase
VLVAKQRAEYDELASACAHDQEELRTLRMRLVESRELAEHAVHCADEATRHASDLRRERDRAKLELGRIREQGERNEGRPKEAGDRAEAQARRAREQAMALAQIRKEMAGYQHQSERLEAALTAEWKKVEQLRADLTSERIRADALGRRAKDADTLRALANGAAHTGHDPRDRRVKRTGTRRLDLCPSDVPPPPIPVIAAPDVAPEVDRVAAMVAEG